MGKFKPGRQLSKTAKELSKPVKSLARDPRAATSIAMAKKGAETAAKTLDTTRKKVTQEEAWTECSSAIEEIVDVLVVQHRLIEALTDKVEQLESEVHGRNPE